MQAVEIAESITYRPRFVPDPDALFAELMASVSFVQRTRVMYGRKVKTPRTEAWFGPRPYAFGGSTLEAKEMPGALATVAVLAEQVTGARFDSCLVNLYRDGRDSVGWHADDEPEMGDPIIASVSLGVVRPFLLRQRHTIGAKPISVTLGHGSLLIMQRGVQARWLHSLPKRHGCLDPRINLTFRDCR